VSVIVRLPTSLAERIDGVKRIELPVNSAYAALETLSARFPALTKLLWSAPGEPNPVMLVFHANRRLSLADFCRALPANAELDIVPAIEAG